MKLLMIGGNIPDNQLESIMSNTIGNFQFAANEFQNKLILGFKKKLGNNFFILSAPFINPYPNGYKKVFYKGYKKNRNEKYVSFLNLWGVRNISRNIHLNNNINNFLSIKDDNKYVIVYSPHVPFLKTAWKIKKKEPNIKIILLLPDLPQFVALEQTQKVLYRLLKPIDIKQFYKYSNKFDSYILLTEQMNDFVNKDRKKSFLVVEGIANTSFMKQNYSNNEKDNKSQNINITYTGTLHKKFGICDLVDAFMLINDPHFKLNICGHGDSENYVMNASKKNNRIHYLGQIKNKEVLDLQRKSNILVNPRKNVGQFTKYSFPSKNIEYLASGTPTIAYKLDGIPDEYDNILFYPKDDTIEELKNKIIEVSKMTQKNYDDYFKKVSNFMNSKNIDNVCKNIIDFLKK